MTKERNVYIKNIFHMLSYAFQGLTQKDEERIDSEEFENTADLLCEILCMGFGRLLRRGLHKEFVSQKEELKTLKGKLDLSQTMRAFANGQRVLVCEHDIFSENNVFNQIILCTMLLFLGCDGVKNERKASVRRLLPYLSEVEQISPKDIQWARLTYSANNREYRLIINICYFALTSLLLTTDAGEYRMKAIANDEQIYRLYEKFILAYYQKEHPNLHASPSQVEWNLDDSDKVLQLPKMKTDISLFHEEKVLIIDAKFYGRELAFHSDKDTYHSGNLYQIFTYVKNKDIKHDGSVSGLLLYAKTEYNLEVSEKPFSLSGNVFRVCQLDLNKPFTMIRQKLDDIVREWLR